MQRHECEGTRKADVLLYAMLPSVWVLDYEHNSGCNIAEISVSAAQKVRLIGIKHCPYCGRRLDAAPMHEEGEGCWND